MKMNKFEWACFLTNIDEFIYKWICSKFILTNYSWNCVGFFISIFFQTCLYRYIPKSTHGNDGTFCRSNLNPIARAGGTSIDGAFNAFNDDSNKFIVNRHVSNQPDWWETPPFHIIYGWVFLKSGIIGKDKGKECHLNRVHGPTDQHQSQPCRGQLDLQGMPILFNLL